MSRSQVFAPHPRRRALTVTTALPAFGSVLLLALGAAQGCGTNNSYYETEYVYNAQAKDAGSPLPAPPEPDAGGPVDPGGNGEEEPDAGDGGAEPPSDGLPRVNSTPQALQVDVFGTVGNRYYFVVSDEQLTRMNENYGGGGFPGGPVFDNGDIYTPGGGNGGGETFVDRLLVSTPGENPKTADFGKVQTRLVGQSTGRPWTTESLPNLKMDTDQFQEGNRVGGVKHFRLNNAVVGSIFREKLTLDLYRALGYPAPRANYAWVQSSVWGPDVSVPYIVVESYKPAFCKQREAELGGGCVNMWEFAGDLGFGSFEYEENCQFSECDATRATQFEADVMATPTGAGFKAALTDWLDWDAFHRFQCLSWILATGDDVLHNSNNFVMVERTDGKFQHLPYSIDISLGQDWYPTVPLAGGSVLARGCQSDQSCWDDLIATCEVVLDEFTAQNPIAMLDQTYATLKQQKMLRDGDEGRYEQLGSYLARRLEELPVELEANREAPPPVICDPWLIQCGDVCMYPEECPFCEPEPEPGPDAGAPPSEPAPVERGLADVAIPMPIPDVPGIPGPDVPPPQQCIPFVELYGAQPAPGLILR
jgi:hypothetical protein